MAGFVEFFYNIIPGGLFILAILTTKGLDKLLPWNIKHTISGNDLLSGSAFVILSLFFGFVLQMANKAILGASWKKESLDKLSVERKNEFELAKERLKKYVGFREKRENETLYFFYFMDNFLWANKYSGLTQFFHAQISLWANIMTASGVYLVIIFILSLPILPLILYWNLPQILLAFGTVIFARSFTKMSIKRFHDTVLTTFLVTTDTNRQRGFLRK